MSIEFLGIQEEPRGKEFCLRHPRTRTVAYINGGHDTIVFSHAQKIRRSLKVLGWKTPIPLPSKIELTRW